MLCKVLDKTRMEHMGRFLEADSWEMKLNTAKVAWKINPPFRSLLKLSFVWFSWLHKIFVESGIKAKEPFKIMKNWKVVPVTLFYGASFQTKAFCSPVLHVHLESHNSLHSPSSFTIFSSHIVAERGGKKPIRYNPGFPLPAGIRQPHKVISN